MTRTRTDTMRAFSQRECLVRGLRMAGQWRLNRAMPNRLGGHIDSDAYEICYLADGGVEWWVEDEIFEVRRGQFFVTKRGELHGAVDAVGHPSHLYWVQIIFPAHGALPGLTVAETLFLEKRFAALRHRVFNASFAAAKFYEDILRELGSPNDCSRLVVRTALHSLLLGALRDEEQHEAVRSNANATRLHQALAWMDQHLTEDYRVEDAAHIAGLAVSQFHKLFMQETGFTPADYRIRQRVRTAKQRLRAGEHSITEIALELGFSSSQYFSSVFKKLTGMTPRDYQQRTQ